MRTLPKSYMSWDRIPNKSPRREKLDHYDINGKLVKEKQEQIH